MTREYERNGAPFLGKLFARRMINGTANKKVMGETIKDRLLVACEVAFTTELDFDLPAFAHSRDHKGASAYKPLNQNNLGRG